jgi:hypothetical protein
MKYMLLVYGAEDAYTEQERNECMTESSRLCHELADKQQYVSSSPLQGVATATSIRVRNGQRQITAGPFAETTEQLGGYYIIDVPGLDDAIEFASRIPPAKKWTIEIRPLHPLDCLPPA